MPNLTQLNEILKTCPESTPSRYFPSIENLLRQGIADSPEQAMAASLLWKRVWANYESHNLRRGGDTPILDQLPATRRWVRACFHRPASLQVRHEALNELLGFYGVEPLYKTRKERGELISTDEIFAWYLNSGDPYAATLIFRVGKTGPTIGCWGDLPEVSK